MKKFIETVRGFEPETIFVCVASTLGVLLVILVPPLQSPDEVQHFSRAYAISELNIRQDNLSVGSGAHSPKAITEFRDTVNQGDLPHDAATKYTWSTAKNALSIHVTSKRQDRMFINLASYAPVAYIPQATGIVLARTVTSRIGVMFYAARVMNLIFFVLLCYVALRLMPIGRWLMVAILISPMALFAASSLSADVSVLVYTSLLISLTIYLWKRKRIGIREWVLLGVVCCLLALSKQAYVAFVPIIALLAIRPTARLRWRRQQLYIDRIVPIVVIFGATLLAYAAWSHFNSGTNTDVSLMQRLDGWNVQPHEQLEKSLREPMYFVGAAFATTFGSMSDDIVRSTFGSFGWLNVNMPTWAIVLYIAAIGLMAGYAGSRNDSIPVGLRRIVLGFSLLLSLVCYIGILVGLFLIWTPIGYEYVAGFQGRYFLPFFLLLVPGLVGWYAHSVRLRYILSSMLVVYIAMLVVLVSRYHISIA